MKPLDVPCPTCGNGVGEACHRSVRTEETERSFTFIMEPTRPHISRRRAVATEWTCPQDGVTRCQDRRCMRIGCLVESPSGGRLPSLAAVRAPRKGAR